MEDNDYATLVYTFETSASDLTCITLGALRGKSRSLRAEMGNGIMYHVGPSRPITLENLG